MEVNESDLKMANAGIASCFPKALGFRQFSALSSLPLPSPFSRSLYSIPIPAPSPFSFCSHNKLVPPSSMKAEEAKKHKWEKQEIEKYGKLKNCPGTGERLNPKKGQRVA
ncbi:hypothetical protein ElyMa_006653700 [Elysia marginata]|uniref:Uncharacterized protein n=1 Tax=Elysia marginata TaxID=1093978 RepID=A0AAV4IP50_9GAST|nr:hypothetical protein ElyMa_006653700 [Elysia marginata]